MIYGFVLQPIRSTFMISKIKKIEFDKKNTLREKLRFSVFYLFSCDYDFNTNKAFDRGVVQGLC